MDFEDLANQHKDAVYRQLMRACGNREDAEDVLIEALLKAYRNLDQLRESGAFRAWLAQIGRRVCWQLKQREALLPILQLSALEEEGMQLVSGQESAETSVGREQMKSLLQRAIESLPAKEREVYELRDIQELGGRGNCHPAQYHPGGDEVPTESRPDKPSAIPGRGVGFTWWSF